MLIGLIAFVLGVVVTLLCLRCRERQDDPRDGQPSALHEKEMIQK